MAHDFSKLKAGIQHTKAWLQNELQGIRTGRATSALLDGIKFEMYGTMIAINQAGSISVEDARSLYIAPWDKGQLKPIEKAITLADLGVGVGSDEKGVRVTFPELTTERRQQLIKLVRQKLEDARVALRSERTRAMEDVEKREKEGEIGEDDARRARDDVQKLIDEANKELEALAEKKEKELAS